MEKKTYAQNTFSETEKKGLGKVPKDFGQLKEQLVDIIGYKQSFDVQIREMQVGGQQILMLFLGVFSKEEVLTAIIKRLTYIKQDEKLNQDGLQRFLEFYIPAVQIQIAPSFAEAIDQVLAGCTAFFVEGERSALVIDARTYPSRTPAEPSLEKVIRGSQDGFTETLLTNVALIRRRLRDPNLRFEIIKAGRRTQTDICVAFIADIANKSLVKSIRKKLNAIDIDGLPLADKQVEEMTVGKSWSPFPTVRYTERPDVVAAQLLDGNVSIIVDTSPSAILLPTTYFDLVQHAEENRQNPFMGTYLRWIRYFGILVSLFILPLWFLYTINPDVRPDWLYFIGTEDTGKVPLILQFVFAEMGVDLLRLAAVHTPAPLVTAMTLVSAILIGDIAVQTGLFVNEVILYMSISAIGMYATPSYELGLANRIVRLLLLLCVYCFNSMGFVGGVTFILLFLAFQRSFNTPYLWPFIPFDAPALAHVLVRFPLPLNKTRPNITRTQKRRKQPR